jgi:hypothetical protein
LIIDKWLESQALVVVERRDSKGNPRNYVAPGPFKD